MKSQRGWVLRPALPCRIPRAWGKLAASRIGGTLQESLAVGETPRRKEQLPSAALGERCSQGNLRSQLTGDGHHGPSYLLHVPHKHRSLSSHPCPFIPTTPHLSRLAHPGMTGRAPQGDASLCTPGILWASGTKKHGPQRLGWVRLSWELGEGAHKAERAGAKTGMWDSDLQGVSPGISPSAEPTASGEG